MRIPRIFLPAPFVLLLTSLFYGQGVATGDLRVTVKDPQGKLVTNATVTVRDEAQGIERPAASNGSGEYSAQALPPASYTVTVTAAGFSAASAPGVVITVGGVEDLPITLGVAGEKESVTVHGDAALIETTRTGVVDTVNQQRIENLPINGRNYINFTLTDSQVVRDNAPNTGAAPTSGLNMSGQRGRSNLVNVDGADATDNSVNGVRSTVSQEAVQEFQIQTNSYQPEYGRASGGVVNIVTKSGANDFHGDVFGFLRNRDFQAVNPFATCPNPPCSKPAYTRVQAGITAGGAIKKDKTFYFFSYEVTRRHETGFSSIGQGGFGLVPFDASPFFGAPAGTFQIQATGGPQGQAAFLQQFVSAPPPPLVPFLQAYSEAVGASSGMAVNGAWPLAMGGQPGFISNCSGPPCFVPPAYQTLQSQTGNFPVFEGTSLYSLRIDHNINNNNRLTLRANVSPSTVTGIEVNGENQVFGQNSFSRTSEQTYRDVAAVAKDTLIIGNNKVNEFSFQFARRGLSYFFNTAAPGGSDIGVDITGVAYIGREPYSYIQRTEKRYQFTDNFSWTLGPHNTKMGVDFNYIPLQATFTVNYGGVYSFSGLSPATLGFPTSIAGVGAVPGFSPVQAYGLGIPLVSVQGIGNPKDSLTNKPLGLYWQDSWKMRPNLTLNYGVRYDVEFPPQLKAPTGLALAGYNSLGLQKGIQTDTNNFQPRVGIAWDPKGDGKTVIRSSYGLFYDHPLLGLYFLGDASDGSGSGQLLFFGSAPCGTAGSTPNSPLNITSTNLFQGILGNANCLPPGVAGALGYQSTSSPSSACLGEANPQRFDPCFPNSLFLNQGYLTAGLPLIQQPFGYPQSKNFVYAYSEQANFSIERDLGDGFSLNLAYNFNGGHHLNRPINANPVRGDLLTANWQAAIAAGAATPSTNPLSVASCGPNPIPGATLPFFVPSALVSFFRPSGINPSLAGGPFTPCVPLAIADLQAAGLNTSCNPLVSGLTGCVPFSDMAANYSNGSSVYHGFSANLRKRFSSHYEFLASYTWAHSIDDSTDLESPLSPQDSFYPSLERSNSIFDQRHRFVFSGVYQSGHLAGNGFSNKFFSDWTLAPIIEVASGRPFNLTTGGNDNFQFVSSGGRPNVVASGTPTNSCGYATVASKISPTGFFQEPCFADLTPAQLARPNAVRLLDGNFARNGGVQPWTLFNDLRVAKRIYFHERMNLDLIVDMFNLANRFNVAAVNQLCDGSSCPAGTATAAYDPRQFQFGMKVAW
jgi:hypothetical protein